MVAAAVAVVVDVVVDDGLPVLFHHACLGRHRRPFVIAKIRSMREGRVTRVGRCLRHSGLDEVMQFWNVLRADMSVVGPRPLSDDDVEAFGWGGKNMDWRFQALPGITGLAEVVGGRTLRHSWRLEQLYLRRHSTPLDLPVL